MRVKKSSARLIPTYPYYIPRRCGNCSRFLGWQPKPEKTRKQQQWQTTISQLLQTQGLTDWERLEGKKLSPKQLKVLAAIETKLGGQQP